MKFVIAFLIFNFQISILNAQIDTIPAQNLEEIVVISTRPINQNLSAKSVDNQTLQTQNNGSNLPFLLTSTPSLVVTSDDGLGVGYTCFRIRGTDHTRINMTVNGVPLNDSESQTVFWVNMTDFASSLNNVQVQRGVGTSTNGTAFGASVNMQTDKTPDKPFASLAFNGGMYGTFRETAKIGTGLLPSGFAFDARFSKVNSNGYLERAKSDLYSYHASAAYFHRNTMVKLLIFGGKEKTYMAWDGIDSATLASNPRFNPAGADWLQDKDGQDSVITGFYKNQTDNYAQQNAQLHFAHQFNNHWNISAALHFTYGNGYYEQWKDNAKFSAYGLQNFVNENSETIKRSDLVRRKNLENYFYGGVFSVNYKNEKLNAILGGAANNYNGAHFGNVLWLKNYPLPLEKDFEYYRNNAEKFDANVYLKASYEILKGLSIFADLQYRHINYKINGINDEDLDSIPINKKFHFFNPKAGINYSKFGHNAYFTFAVANREPTRKNYTEAGIHDIPKPETLFDYELGYNYNFPKKIFFVGVNLYFMNYKNQLVLTGKYSDTGAALTQNVKKSYRAGIEIIGGVLITEWLRWNLNVTLSQNKILNFTDWVDDWYADWDNTQVIENEGQVEVNYGKTDISFSPNIIAGSLFSVDIKGFSANLQTLFVGKQYLDNTQNKSAMLKPYSVTNLVLAYSLFCGKSAINRAPTVVFKIMANNLLNMRYASNGGANSYFKGADANGNFLPQNQKYLAWYYAQAGVNIHGGIEVNF
ncbi:MAG: TonB-dependent receptor [Prevotellaceae bacterium]|nr:TonB-dependent receptor [Prevotellaceae bacterium]